MVKKIVLRSFLGFLTLIVIILLFLPLISKKIIVSNSKEWIGRSISLEKLKINYFTGTVKLVDFKLFESDDTSVFVGFDTLILDTEPYRLLDKNLVVEQFYLKGLHVNVVMYDTTFNFDDLMELGGDSESESKQDKSPSSEPLRFDISKLELKDAFFTILDAEINDTIELSNFNFFLPHLAWNQAEESKADLKFDFKNGGYFESNIDLNSVDGSFDLNFTLGNYDISGYKDFVAKYIDAGSFEGIVDLDVNLVGNLASPKETKVSSKFIINDFALYDVKQKKMVGAKRFMVDLEKAELTSRQILIDSIQIEGPAIYFEMYDSTSNIAEYMNRILPPNDTLNKEEAENEVVKSDTSQQIFLSINKFLLDSGRVDFIDKTHEETFDYQISNIQVSTDSISSNSSWLEMDINMLLGDRGKMFSEVGINPKSPNNVTVEFSISDLMLSDFDMYCREFMGHQLLYGDMNIKSHTDVRNDTLVSENNIVIYNLKLGRKESAVELPLKFAMFLMKDKDGVVNIDMPMEGYMGDSDVSLGGLILDTFTNLITKIVSAPFKIIGAAVDVVEGDIKEIPYDYLDTTLTDKKQKQLDALLEIEQKEKELEIELVYFKDSINAIEQIAIQLIGMEYNKSGRRDYKRESAKFKKYVDKKVKNDTLNLEDACLLLADRMEIESISKLYDSARYRSLMRYLKSKNDSTEILIIPYSEGAPKNKGTKPVFEVKFGMKDEQVQ